MITGDKMKAWKLFLLGGVVLFFITLVNADEQGGLLQGREMAAALAISIPAIGASYAIAVSGSASAGAVAEKPEVFGKVVVFVAFAEAIAIYGLLVALIISLGIGG